MWEGYSTSTSESMSGSMYCTRASTPCEYYSTIQCEYKYRASTSYSYSYPYSYSSSTPRIKILQYPLHRTVHARLVIDPVDIYTVIGPKTSINDRRHGLAPGSDGRSIRINQPPFSNISSLTSPILTRLLSRFVALLHNPGLG